MSLGRSRLGAVGTGGVRLFERYRFPAGSRDFTHPDARAEHSREQSGDCRIGIKFRLVQTRALREYDNFPEGGLFRTGQSLGDFWREGKLGAVGQIDCWRGAGAGK